MDPGRDTTVTIAESLRGQHR
jgi:hypothetical protein